MFPATLDFAYFRQLLILHISGKSWFCRPQAATLLNYTFPRRKRTIAPNIKKTRESGVWQFLSQWLLRYPIHTHWSPPGSVRRLLYLFISSGWQCGVILIRYYHASIHDNKLHIHGKSSIHSRWQFRPCHQAWGCCHHLFWASHVLVGPACSLARAQATASDSFEAKPDILLAPAP